MLKRFIRYLYEYEQGKRMRNVGFVKVDQDDEECVIHIHGKGLRLEGERELAIYLFYEQDKECIGVMQGIIENVNPAVNYQLHYTREDVGVPENYPLIEGIIMENKSHRKYAAVWNDMPVNVNDMRPWSEEKHSIKEQEETPEIPEEMTDPIPEQAELEAEVSESEEPELEQMEVCRCETAVQEKHCKNSGRKYTKMQRQEIASLPRCEWKLSNNSFLLHGYYNYHHLMLIEESENRWLGVPGIYHNKEARAAESFGFPQFVKFEEMDVELSEEERNDNEDFGYWCRHIRK